MLVTDAKGNTMQFVNVSITGGYRLLSYGQTDKVGVATLRWAQDLTIAEYEIDIQADGYPRHVISTNSTVLL